MLNDRDELEGDCEVSGKYWFVQESGYLSLT